MKKAVAIGLASLLSLTVFLASPLSVTAQTADKPQTVDKPPPGTTKNEYLKQIKERNEAIEAAKNDNVVNKQDHDEKTLDNIFKALICQGAGELAGCKTINSNGEEEANAGAVGTAVSWIGDMYKNPPANTATYVASVMQDLRMAPPAYAQGLGFSSLSPILTIWETMRNIAYFFFVAAFIVIGFMIMFRQKISGQAVVTAQQAIPQIIIALITVTFSYAIAGLLIDGMYLIMLLIAGLFGKTDLINGNVFEISKRLIDQNTAGSGANALGELVRSALGEGAIGLIGQLVSTVAAAVIILIVIIFNTFKLFFALLRVYVELILQIAFAPVILMTGAIPGQNPFGPWVRSIVGNLAVFPAIMLLLIVFDVIRESTVNATGGFLPPYVAGYSAPEVLPLLAGTALILALPNVVEETRKAFGVQTSGFFGNLLQAGMKNANQYRTLGLGAGTAVVGGLAGGMIGAGIGARNALTQKGTASQRLGRVFDSATRGVFYGGVGTPLVTTIAPPLVKGFARTIGQQAQDIAAQDLIRSRILGYESRRFAKESAKRGDAKHDMSEAKKNSPQSTTGPQLDTHDDVTDSNAEGYPG